jgi:hypothetical protein
MERPKMQAAIQAARPRKVRAAKKHAKPTANASAIDAAPVSLNPARRPIAVPITPRADSGTIRR